MNGYVNIIRNKDQQIVDLNEEIKSLNAKIEDSYENFSFKIREVIERTRK